ncbi:MAG TPA: response regulator [Dissulfurispiraceae bacterium]|nr:response regulator [Dissulfurispiraceae bacterium]
MTPDAMLCVDDEQYIRDALKRAFFDLPVRVFVAANAQEALAILKREEIKIVISDERMPGMTGAELLEIVRREHPDTIRIMLTGYASLKAAISAINRGEIYRFFTKPWDDVDLRFAVQAALEKYNLEAENRRLLAIVRQQAVDLRLLERQYPGIAEMERDEQGRIIVADVSPEELAVLAKECERIFEK